MYHYNWACLTTTCIWRVVVHVSLADSLRRHEASEQETPSSRLAPIFGIKYISRIARQVVNECDEATEDS